MTGRLARLADGVERATTVPLAAGGAVMVGIVLAGTFWRYVLGDPLLWTEEAARYLMIWIGLIGASVAIRRGEHIRISLLVGALPRRVQRGVELVIGLLVLGFLGVLVWVGGRVALEATSQVSPALGVPMAVPLAVVPISGALMAVQLVLRMAMALLGDPAGVFGWEAEDDAAGEGAP